MITDRKLDNSLHDPDFPRSFYIWCLFPVWKYDVIDGCCVYLLDAGDEREDVGGY
jgi:hypothetical protein